jgi:acyl-CoA synthetase (AMP-forming)/AMP-acid ligase II
VTLLNYLATQDVLDALVAGRCTGLAGVPTLWVAFCAALRSGQADPRHLAALRYVTNSGGRLGLAEIATLRERLPWVSVFSMYGLTEAFRSAYLPPEHIDRLPGSIGKAIPEVELLVVDPTTRRECAPGETGELVHTGALIADGYWRREADTARVFGRDPRDPARGRAVFSGDFVRRDAEGWLWFVGRRDQQLKVMGYRVSPEEVEAELRAVDGVLDACVFGVPDPALGDRLVAGITARPGPGAGLARRSLVALKARLPAWLVPATIEVVAELPLNQNGKPDARELARRLGYGGGLDAAP